MPTLSAVHGRVEIYIASRRPVVDHGAETVHCAVSWLLLLLLLLPAAKLIKIASDVASSEQRLMLGARLIAIPSNRFGCPYKSSIASQPRRLYILCWSELSRRKLSPTLATPTTLVLTTPVAQCELSRRKIGLLWEVVGRKFSHRPGNPAAAGVVRWPAAGDTAGSSLRRLSSLQHRIYNLLGRSSTGAAAAGTCCQCTTSSAQRVTRDRALTAATAAAAAAREMACSCD